MAPRENFLDRLGYDVFYLVLKMLSQADLYAISLVSQSLRSASEPLLYSKIELTWSRTQTPAIVPLLRTILCRTELAAYIRGLFLLGDDFHNIDNEKICLPKLLVDGMDLSQVVKAIHMTGARFGQFWLNEYGGGSMDALVTLLISRLHNLRDLYIDRNFGITVQLLGLLLDSALLGTGSRRLPTFQHLRSVHYDLDAYSRRLNSSKNTSNVLPFFYLPQIQHLFIALDNPVTLSWPIDTPPNLSRITSLTLKTIREKHLHRLLSKTSGLQTLRWQYYYCKRHAHDTCTSLVDLGEVGAALYHVRNTLKELTITTCIDLFDAPDPPALYIRGSLAVLADFVQLEKLELPLQLFTCTFTAGNPVPLRHVVPRSTQSLTIRYAYCFGDDDEKDWYCEDTYELIVQWLCFERASRSSMRTLTISWEYMKEKPLQQKLTELCESHGIDFEVTRKIEYF
jgi:hypothetical protein